MSYILSSFTVFYSKRPSIILIVEKGNATEIRDLGRLPINVFNNCGLILMHVTQKRATFLAKFHSPSGQNCSRIDANNSEDPAYNNLTRMHSKSCCVNI